MHCNVFACETAGLRTQHPPFFCRLRPGWCHECRRHHPAGSPALKSVLMDCLVHSQLLSSHHLSQCGNLWGTLSYFTRRGHKLVNQSRFFYSPISINWPQYTSKGCWSLSASIILLGSEVLVVQPFLEFKPSVLMYIYIFVNIECMRMNFFFILITGHCKVSLKPSDIVEISLSQRKVSEHKNLLFKKQSNKSSSYYCVERMTQKSVTAEVHLKAPEVFYYLISKSHSSCGSFNSPMLHYWGVRYHPCVLPPSHSHIKLNVSVCTRFICVCAWNRERLWALTPPGHMIFQLKHVCRWNVYLCPCFCCAPVTRPGNLLDWLVNYSPGDLPNLFLIPFSSWNRSSLERQTWHLKDVWRLILAGRPTTSLDTTWNPTLNPVVPANFFNTGNCTQVTLWGLCKQECIYL